MNRPHVDDFWAPTAHLARGQEELNAPSTQLVADEAAYLGQGRHDVGRRISDDQVELFVEGDVASALQREFTRHAPEFIACHDVGASASIRLLSSLAGAAGAQVQRLAVRRQGAGAALAVLSFVEVPLADGHPVRVYATDIHAEAAVRAAVARVLLAHSKLAVLLAGEQPAHVLAAQLAPLHDAMSRGAWPNRDLLLVPLGHSPALAAQGAQLAHGSPVAVHVTPHAAKPRHVWTFIGGAWNRLHGGAAGERAVPTEMSRAVPKPAVPSTEATTEPMPLETLRSGPARTAEPAPPPQPMPVPGSTPWQAYVERCALIKGTQAACVFDLHALSVMAAAGGPPSSQRLAQQAAALLGAAQDGARSLGIGPAAPELALSAGNHHLLVRPVPGHPGVALALLLHAAAGNLMLAKMQLERIGAPA